MSCYSSGVILSECSISRFSCYAELDSGRLGEQIQGLGLNVAVSWIGSHLQSFVNERTLHGKPTLFFSWVPNTLTAAGNYTRVMFPSCKTGGAIYSDISAHGRGCDFEVNQLSKFAWIRLKTHTPEAYHMITHMTFTQQEYEDLLRLYVTFNPHYLSNDSYLETAACEWVLENEVKWQKWLPKNLSSKTKIYLGGMFPETGPYWRQPGIRPGITPSPLILFSVIISLPVCSLRGRNGCGGCESGSICAIRLRTCSPLD